MMAAPACSRTGLFVGVGGSSGVRSDAGPGDAAPPTCADDAGVGKLARTSGPQQSAANAAVIDPNDDVLVVLGGTSSSGVYAKAISTVSLATGETQTLSRSGDSRVDLGPNGRALWDAVHDRGIVLGLGLSPWESNPPRDDKRQVFAVRLQGNSAHLALLPDFPEGQTSDIALAAAIDPVTDRLYAIPGKGSVPGPVHTWALRLAPGQESWSMFDNDSQAALQKVQLLSLSLDPVGRRLLAVGSEIYPGKQRSLWALSLDAPSGWTRIPGTFPPDLSSSAHTLGGGFPLSWDPEQCAFITAVTGNACLYDVWRLDIGSAFVATPLGVAVQPAVRYGRGAAAFDAHRRNFVFAGGYDCNQHDYPSHSTDFVALVP
jgi:hypothetical protein